MKKLTVKPAGSCRFDIVSLGEVMLRLDPGETRIYTTRTFHAWEGGGEYNVARGLRRCFGLQAAVVTALADNPIGRLVEDLMLQGGVDLSFVKWVPYDGVGRVVRNGLNFTERGFGARGGVGCSDRANTAISQLRSEDIDWDALFDRAGTRWFHTGGVFSALSKTTPDVARVAMQRARHSGSCVSFDLNYRDSLWRAIGGPAQAREVNQDLVREVDVLFGNEEDFAAALGFELNGVSDDYSELPIHAYQDMLQSVADAFPNLSAIAVTLRTARSATLNDWGALALCEGEFFHVPQREVMILDRVGGGDSFASGFLYGLLSGKNAEWALSCGVAHGELAMTTPGDTTMATLREVERLMQGGNARIVR